MSAQSLMRKKLRDVHTEEKRRRDQERACEEVVRSCGILCPCKS